MSIKYSVVRNPLQPGQFYPRPVALNTRELGTLIRNVAAKTTVSPSDTGAVVTAFIEEIVHGLIDGDRVSITGLADFRPRLSQVLTSPKDSFDFATGGEVLIAATIKPVVTKRLRADAEFEKLVQPTKFPLLTSLTDVASGNEGVYTAGSIAELSGKNLRLFDRQAADEGIFFIAQSDGAENKVSVIQNNGDRLLVFEIPESLTGVQNVEVRTRYGEGGELRTGILKNITPV